jgi:hypothetical protein
MAKRDSIFEPGFLYFLRVSVDLHHQLYPAVPPQGIYFEALVERTFREIHKPMTVIRVGGATQPRYDILFEGHRISLKTETGKSTKPDRITITKLCTTEKEPWTADSLKARALAHLARYDAILMLRTIWTSDFMHYQLVDIPVNLLGLIETADPHPVGRREGRRSLGADVLFGNEIAFRVHFDASDGKCQIRGLRVSDCRLLSEWDKERPPTAIVAERDPG